MFLYPCICLSLSPSLYLLIIIYLLPIYYMHIYIYVMLLMLYGCFFLYTQKTISPRIFLYSPNFPFGHILWNLNYLVYI